MKQIPKILIVVKILFLITKFISQQIDNRLYWGLLYHHKFPSYCNDLGMRFDSKST